MAAWVISDAIQSLRSLLGDTDVDKYVFKSKCYPPPDGITTRFFAGDTRLVDDTLEVFVNGNLVSPTGTPDVATGSFDLSYPPAANVDVFASYYYQWFNDAQLLEFLTAGVQSLAIETIDDVSLPFSVRPASLDFACYYAFMFKAAEYASGLQGSAEGFSVDKSKPSPNWKALADAAWKAGEAKLKLATSNPLADLSPVMRFTTYRLPLIQPIS